MVLFLGGLSGKQGDNVNQKHLSIHVMTLWVLQEASVIPFHTYQGGDQWSIGFDFDFDFGAILLSPYANAL